MMTRLQLKGVLAALAAAAMLAACGGGDNNDGVAAVTPSVRATDVPSSALQNVAALLAYLGELIGQSSDTAEPIALGDAAAPTSDTAEPVN